MHRFDGFILKKLDSVEIQVYDNSSYRHRRCKKEAVSLPENGGRWLEASEERTVS